MIGPVAVVGGGIAGLSVAFHLARRGAEVTLVERAGVASGATGRALGGVRYLFDRPINVGLMARNLRFFEDFESEVGIPVEFSQDGYCYLFRDERVERIWRSRVEMYREHGLPVEVLDPDGVEAVCDLVDTSGIRGALFGPRCGFVDPHSVASALAERTRELGGSVRTNTAVRDVLVEDGRVRGVETDSGRVAADHVVDAAGPWAGRVAEMAGVDLPIGWTRTGFVALDFPDGRDTPLTIDEAIGTQMRGEATGELFVGAGKVPLDGPGATDLTREDRVAALERAARVMPIVADLGVRSDWTGTLTTTPDGHAVVGPVGPEGFHVIGGFSGYGLMIAPAVGEGLAETLLDGHTDLFDIDALSPSRFDDGGLETEMKSTSTGYTAGEDR